MKTLICGAIDDEINLIQDKAPKEYLVKRCGIGLIDAAVTVANILRVKTEIKRVIFTGTAGAYPQSGLNIGDIVNVTQHELIGVGDILKQSYFPEMMPRRFQFSDFFNGAYRAVKSTSVLEITKDAQLAAKIEKSTSAQTEHMELFSIARICHHYKVEFNGIVAISNHVGPNAHEEWKKHNKSVSKKAQISIILNLEM